MNIDKRLFREAKAVRTGFMLTVALGFLGGIATVLQARYVSDIINNAFLEHDALVDLQPLFVILLLTILARALFIWGSEIAANRVAGEVKQKLRERLFAHIVALGPTYASGERTGELTNTAVEGIEALDAYFSQYLPQLALAALVPLTVLLFVLPRDPLSGLVLFLTAPIIPIFMVLIGKLADSLTKKQWHVLSRMSAHFLDVLQGLTTLKILGRSREQIDTIAAISERFRQTTLGVLRVAFLSALVLELVATISTAVVAVEVGLRLLYGHMVFREAFFVLLLAPEFYLPLRMLGTRFHAGMSGVAAAKRIFAVLETPLPAMAVTAPFSAAWPLERMEIRFRDVHFAYESGERPALQGVSFRIPAGKKVALVGPTGAGKSSIAHLLLRFIEPDRGEISVDGMPLRTFPADVWRQQVAWVPQRPYLFHDSVAANIRLGRPDASRKAILRAAKLAHVHEFVASLPAGYDTIIGEQGARFSGGQAQRIALARAFLKDAPLLILDEATSNLDPENEAVVQEATLSLMAGRSVLIIAHRLSTVYQADQIVVLAGGRVVESGRHAELIRQGGLYQRLVTAYGGAG